MNNQHPEQPAGEAPWEARLNRPRKGRVRRIVSWSIPVAVVGVIVWGLWPRPVEVETEALTRGPLTVFVTEEGKTRIRNRYVVAAPVAGRMRRVALKPGDEVRAGETLLTAIEPTLPPLLDPRSLAQAEARVEAMEAARDQAGESLAAAEAMVKFAEARRDRIGALRAPGSVSDTDRDDAVREAAMRGAELRAARFARQVAEFALAQAQAALLTAAPDGSAETIEVRSPVSGRVLKVMQESETVAAQGMSVLEVGDPADIEIEAEILSRDAVRIEPGDAVIIEQWGGESPLEARVRRIEPAAFTKISALGVEEQRVYVLCDLVNPPAAASSLGDRFRVDVRVAVWHADDVLLAPSGAVYREGNAWKAMVLRGGRAREVEVRADHTNGRLTEINGGLQEGDVVLVHPPDTVDDGSRVRERESLR